MGTRWSAIGFTDLACGLLLFAAASRAECSGRQPLMLRLSNCSNTQPGVDSWGALLSVAGQNLCVMPSAFTRNIYLMGTDICEVETARQGITSSQCQSWTGGTFNPTSARNRGLYSHAPDSDFKPDRNWENINTDSDQPFGSPGKTTLDFPLGPSLVQVPVSAINDGSNHNLPHLGFEHANSTFLRALARAGYPADGWGLNVGSTSVANPRPGNAVFGGFDPASVRGPFTSFPINYDVDPTSERYCPFQVEIKSLEIRTPGGPLGNVSNMLIEKTAGGTKACIEPLFRFSQSALDRFLIATGYDYDKALDPEFFVVEPGLIRSQPYGFSLVITLETGKDPFTVEIPNEELEQPRRVINTEGRRVLLGNVTEARIFNATVLDRIVLGRAFLSQVYLTCRFPRDIFQLAPIVTDLVTPQPVSFDCSPDDLASTVPALKKGMIALGTVLGVALLLLVGMLYVHGYAGDCLRRLLPNHHPHTNEVTNDTVELDQT